MPWTPKDPASIEIFFFDFTAALAEGDSVASLTSIVADQGDGLLTLTAPNFTGNVARVTASGGTLSTSYRLVAKVLTAQAETLVLHGSLAIRST